MVKNFVPDSGMREGRHVELDSNIYFNLKIQKVKERVDCTYLQENEGTGPKAVLPHISFTLYYINIT